MDGSRMPPKGSNVAAAQRTSATASAMSLANTWTMPGPPARRGGAEVGQPTVVGLDAGPAPLVVLRRRRQRHEIALAEEGGTVFGKRTSAAMPSDSVSARRRSLSQLR